MESIVISGDLDPLDALDLRARLLLATAELRPLVEVDLRDVTSLHVAAVAALIDSARRAQRHGGELRIEPPTSPSARRELGLSSWFPPCRLTDRVPR